MLNLEELRKVGTCVFLAAEKEVAEDIARHIMDAADEIERLQAALKPFAEVAREWDGEPDSLEVELKAYDTGGPGLSVSDFRRADETLHNEQEVPASPSPKCPGCGAVIASYCPACQRQLES
jgi:hypothetical protein